MEHVSHRDGASVSPTGARAARWGPQATAAARGSGLLVSFSGEINTDGEGKTPTRSPQRPPRMPSTHTAQHDDPIPVRPSWRQGGGAGSASGRRAPFMAPEKRRRIDMLYDAFFFWRRATFMAPEKRRRIDMLYAAAFPVRSCWGWNEPGTVILHQNCIKISGCADFREQLVPERKEQSPQDQRSF